MKRKILLSLAAAAAAFCPITYGLDVVKDGQPTSVIVIAPNAPPPVRHGGEELAAYLKKITGAEIGISHGASANHNNLFIGTFEDPEIVKRADLAGTKVKEDGFVFLVKGRDLFLVGSNPRGALYGCYHLLKKYGGIRFLVPGEEGEYYTEKKTISIPDQKTMEEPFLRVRKTVANEMTAFKWLLRNNMLAQTTRARFIDPATGKRTKEADKLDALAVTGAAYGGHIMALLMGGGSWKGLGPRLDELYAQHPEYFPLIKGQRVKFNKGGSSPNPCVSNPGLLDLLAENLYKNAHGEYGSQHPVILGNDDTTVWCECEKCAALDDPKKAGTKGARADRYWYMVNEVAKRVWKKDPSIRIAGWAYQDFWYPPTKVKIDPRIMVIISYNNQCWRHSIMDEKCSVNRELCRIMEAWRKNGHPFIINRDEIGAYDGGGSPGFSYLPSEKVLFENFRQYPVLGFTGTSFCVNSPYPPTLKFLKKTAPYYGKNLFWYAMWQINYLSSISMWRKDFDFAGEYETINSLYYGKAWEGGMKEFRTLLTKCFTETPGCIGWGQGAPLGRCLDQAGSEEKLLALLDKAVAAAKEDKDPRVLKHVQRDKEIFLATWINARKTYLANFRELAVYKRTAPIVIDGVLEEKDWKNADALSNFQPGGMTRKGTKIQPTSVRVTYDTDTLYIAVECMEPEPERIIAGKNVPHDDTGWATIGNSVELFYSYPDMGEKYFHIVVNSNGEVLDAKHGPGYRDAAFRTAAKVATKVLKDRWVLEMAVPTSEIGMKCYDGATWKLNVARQRKLAPASPGGKEVREASSCSNGAFHGSANFVNMKFVPARAVGIQQGADVSAWKNADFNTAIPDKKRNRYERFGTKKGWTFADEKELVPAFWNVSGDVEGTFLAEEGKNYFIRLKKGYVTQYFLSRDKGKLSISFRARGEGYFHIWTCSYRNYKDRNAKGYDIMKETAKYMRWKLTPEWKSYTLETVKTGVPTERVAIRFTADGKGHLDLDDVYVTPIPE